RRRGLLQTEGLEHTLINDEDEAKLARTLRLDLRQDVVLEARRFTAVLLVRILQRRKLPRDTDRLLQEIENVAKHEQSVDMLLIGLSWEIVGAEIQFVRRLDIPHLNQTQLRKLQSINGLLFVGQVADRE